MDFLTFIFQIHNDMMKIIALKIYRYRKKKIGIYINTKYIYIFFFRTIMSLTIYIFLNGYLNGLSDE